jgi:hypothetical protein
MWSKYMAKAKFTQDQLNEAVAEFFGQCEVTEKGETFVECTFLPGAGNNGTISVYKLGAENGQNEG